MRLLLIGDIVGRPGRRAVRECLPSLRQKYQLDFVIANGENAAGGNGLTPAVAEELFSCGIDVLTGGNHIWDKKEVFPLLDAEPRIIRPANYPPGAPGVGYGIFSVQEHKVAVINLCGRVFMPDLDCPFRLAESLVTELRAHTPLIVVDFHAEATSEKIAFGWFLDGRVTAVIGTHTHVQTADERILPGGTAYLTDVGMTGPRDGVIGVKKEIVIEKFLSQLPRRFEVASGPYQFNGCVITVDPSSGKALAIERVQIYEDK
ncbi:TIGR00282 family metallophosphoesterase [Ammonifex degensii]|uniref:TIGR00282 family metallophosphoesterase n=1 Tax=Ammonifex degensii TaxID=42838 RepID=UPI00059C4127|nr:TIGR00282 family metallophosphoesterase [Ammonifex degensii]